MQRIVVALATVGLVAAIVFLAGSGSRSSLAVQQVGEGTPVASPQAERDEAELADLRTRVAELSTRVAELGGADAEAVTGRLGGSRAGFDDRYGRPVTYPGPEEVVYDVPDAGRVAVRFEDDRATRIVLAAPRPADVPLDQPDAADWSDEAATSIAARFYPADAQVGEPAADGEQAFVVSGTSEALTGAMAPADVLGCPVGGATPFAATFTRSGPEQVSVAVIETAPPGTASALPAEPAEPGAGQLSQGGSRAVANSSLGGTVSVNGVQMVATSARANAQGSRPPAEGYAFFTVDLRIENQTAQPLTYELSDFILVDRRGREATAICGGIEPAITRGEVAPGAGVEGVVTFEVPERFRAERFVALVDGARVGFLVN
jgi:hypothetical protein